jgi:putative transposase
LGKPDSLVKTHPLTQALGRTRRKRHDRYPALFRASIDADGLTDIRAACQTGTPLGNDAFKAKIERKLHCQAGQARRGRPKRPNKGL